jgi:glycerate 2-kinase
MNNREIAERIFISGVRAVLPEKIINGIMSVKGSELNIGSYKFCLDDYRNVYIIGAGKASAAMAHYVENILDGRITGGHVVVKYGYSCKLEKVRVSEAGHPVPDLNSFRAAGEIVELAKQAGENDLAICLISGGGSSLLSDLPDGLLPEELAIVNNLLVRCGASIDEINCVRKHLSLVKGGQLARIVWPATLVSVILSDVAGNLIDVIASGPTVPDPSTFREAIQVIEKYDLTSGLTNGILNYLKDGSAGNHPETPKPGDPVFSKTFNILAGTNMTALEASAKEAANLGFTAFIADDKVRSDVETTAQAIFEKALHYRKGVEITGPVCLLYGGEPTIKVTGTGLGGRNQHLALSVASRLRGIPGITFLSAGTDGSDGPTPAAGAVVDGGTITRADAKKVDYEKYLSEYNSYNFFRLAGGQVKTGPTFTNVMDLMVVLIDRNMS